MNTQAPHCPPSSSVDLNPYASFIVLKRERAIAASSGTVLASPAAAIAQLLTANSSTLPRPPGQTSSHDELDVECVHLTEKRAVPWASASFHDTLNHLLVTVTDKQFMLIHCSESDFKAPIRAAALRGTFVGWELAGDDLLIEAFLSNRKLKTIWMGGMHRQVTVKPDSKVLSGVDLADALDPFGDSTYIAGAARSASHGVSLSGSSIWIGPSRDWNHFLNHAAEALASLATGATRLGQSPVFIHHGLARRIPTVTGVFGAYAAVWSDAETLSSRARSRQLQALSDTYAVEIDKGYANKPGFFLKLSDPSTHGSASVEVTPVLSNGRLKFTLKNQLTSVPNKFQQAVSAILAHPEFIRVFFESGHTIASGALSLTPVQDRDFTLDFGDFSGYDVAREKPPGNPVPFSDMFSPGDTSLFKWLFKVGLPSLKLTAPSKGSCWLHCDDGSGEVADFIHVDASPGKVPRITLIHIKRAGSGSPKRRVSVGPYEIVVAQAMKNMRRVLAQEVSQATSRLLALPLDAAKKLTTSTFTPAHPTLLTAALPYDGERTWDRPWHSRMRACPTAKRDLLRALQTIGTDCEYEVIIVQPHVTHANYMDKKTGKPKTSMGHRQLRSLLFGAQAMARSASAKFRVVVSK